MSLGRCCPLVHLAGKSVEMECALSVLKRGLPGGCLLLSGLGSSDLCLMVFIPILFIQIEVKHGSLSDSSSDSLLGDRWEILGCSQCWTVPFHSQVGTQGDRMVDSTLSWAADCDDIQQFQGHFQWSLTSSHLLFSLSTGAEQMEMGCASWQLTWLEMGSFCDVMIDVFTPGLWSGRPVVVPEVTWQSYKD